MRVLHEKDNKQVGANLHMEIIFILTDSSLRTIEIMVMAMQWHRVVLQQSPSASQMYRLLGTLRKIRDACLKRHIASQGGRSMANTSLKEIDITMLIIHSYSIIECIFIYIKLNSDFIILTKKSIVFIILTKKSIAFFF